MASATNGIYEQLCTHAREVALLAFHAIAVGVGRADQAAAGRRRVSGRADELPGRARSTSGRPRRKWASGWPSLADSPLAADPHSDTGADHRQPEARLRPQDEAAAGAGRGAGEARGAGSAGVGRGPQGERLRAVSAALGEDDRAQAAGGGGDRLRRRAVRCAARTNTSRAKRRPRSPRAGRRCANNWCRWWRRSSASRRRPNLDDPARPLSDRLAGIVRPAGRRGDRLRFRRRPARCDGSSVLLARSARATCGSPRATTSTSFPARCSARCTKRATASTSRACGPTDSACRPARPCRSASTNRNRGCGRTWSAAAARFGSTSIRRRSATFPAQSLGDVSLDDFYFAINDVRPSLDPHRIGRSHVQPAHPDSIRTGAGAARTTTCAWPICRRRGTRSIASTWASSRRPTPTACCRTCTGAAGLFGYFPTYSLGNLYAAQFFEQAERRPGRFRGDVRPRRISCRCATGCAEHVHQQGRRYPAAELVQRITGRAAIARRAHAASARQIRAAVRSGVGQPFPTDCEEKVMPESLAYGDSAVCIGYADRRRWRSGKVLHDCRLPRGGRQR